MATLLSLSGLIISLNTSTAGAEEEEPKIYYGEEVDFGTIMPGESRTIVGTFTPSVKANVGAISAEPGVFTVPLGENHCSGVNNLTPPATCTFSVKYTAGPIGENVTGVAKISMEESNAPHKKEMEWHLLKGHSR
jgi:hypothetical protein